MHKPPSHPDQHTSYMVIPMRADYPPHHFDQEAQPQPYPPNGYYPVLLTNTACVALTILDSMAIS